MRKSQQKNDDSEEVEQDSQIFKMGVAALRKAQNSSQINVSTEKSKPSTTSSPVTNGLFSSLVSFKEYNINFFFLIVTEITKMTLNNFCENM